MNRLCTRLVPIVLVGTLVSQASAGVIVVQSGVPDLSTTVDAAAPGDTILVKGGGSGFVVTVTGKPLTIVVDPPGSFQLSSVRVRDLPAGESCSVCGFAIGASFVAIEVTNCAGSVRIADLSSVSSSVGVDAAIVTNSPDVAFTRCALRGGDGMNPSVFPGVALTVASNSRVATFGSSLRGGRGGDALLNMVFSTIAAQPGSAAVLVDGTSQFFASDCSIEAGTGGTGRNIGCHITTCLPPSSGGAGGTALESSPSALTTTVGCVLTPGNGGVGGTGGFCCGSGTQVGNAPNGVSGTTSSGPFATLPGNAVMAAIPTYARVNQSLPVTISGAAGDAAYLAVSTTGQWLFAPSLGGVLTPGPLVRRVSLGMIPGSGVLQTSWSVPELAVVTQSFLLHVQPVTVSVTLERHVGGGQTVCWLGPGF